MVELTLDKVPTSAVTVNYFTKAGTASTADFEAQAGTVTFAIGQTKAFITIKTIDDAAVEANETFTVEISGASIAASVSATVTISDAADVAAKAAADAAAAEAAASKTFELTASTPSVVEGDAGTTSLVYILTLNEAPTSAVTVNFETLSTGTATPGIDFVANAGAVTFAAGQTNATVTIAVNGDTAFEADETVVVRFSGSKLAAPVTATGTIVNDDADPQIALTSAYNSALSAYNTAATAAADALTAATQANAAYEAAADAVTDIASANAAITLAATSTTAANAALTAATAQATAATALQAAATATTATDDDTVAANAVSASSIARTSATAAVTAAGADATTAATVLADFAPQTFILTAGVDGVNGGTDYTGGRGNDIFTASNATWNALDVIDGVSGSDTFTIAATAAIAGTPAGARVLNIDTINISSTDNTVGAVTLNTTTDATNYTGLSALNVTTSVAGATQVLTTGAGVNVTASGQDALTINGGNAVNAVTTSGNLTIGNNTAAVGAVVATNTGAGNGGVQAITGGSSQTVSITGAALTNNQTGSAVTLGGTTGAVNVTVANTSGATAAQTTTGGVITVNGGSTVTVNQSMASTVNAAATNLANGSTALNTQGAVNINGTASTTSVTVNQSAAVAAVNVALSGRAGVAAGQVTINDAQRADATNAGTISSVSLTNFGDSTVDSSALTSVTLGGTGGTFGIGRGNLTAVPTANTLALNTNALRGGVITDAEAAAGDDGFTTINLANTGTSVIADLVAADLTTLNISGSGALTLTANTLGGALTTAITSTSTGSVTLGGAALNVGTIYTGGEGVDTITVGATTRAITLGGGDDRVTMSVAVGAGGSVDGGTGTNTLVMAFADAVAASANATFEAGISNFQRLDLGTLAGAVTVNLANLDDINHVTASGSAAAADTTTISGFTSGGTFVQTALLGGGSTVLTGDFAGASDTFNLTFRGTNGFVNAGVLTLDNVETVNITTNDTDAVAPTAVFDANIDATSAVNVSISGNVGMTFANSNLGTAVRNFDASGVTGTGVGSAVTYTTLALTGASTLTGGAGVNTINAAQAVAAVTITGGALADTLTGSATRSSTLNGGGGNDILTGGVAADVINGGEGVDTFQFSSVDIVPNGLPGSGTTEGVVINLSANAISAGDVFTATGRFISGVSLQASVASNTATYLFNNESNTNASVVDTLISIENVIGTNLDDYIVGSDAANVIRGGAGADVLTGGLGNDTFVLQTTAALNGADRITDFMTGTNVIDFAFGDGGLLNNAALRGNGNVYEELATGGALGANTGFVNFTTVVADFNNATVLAAANTLTTGGAAATFGAGDIIYFAVSNNTDSAIFRLVENNAAGSALDAAELLVTLTGVNLAALTGLTAANFADFA